MKITKNVLKGLSILFVLFAFFSCSNPISSQSDLSLNSDLASESIRAVSGSPVGFGAGTTGGQGGVTKSFKSLSEMQDYFDLRASNNEKKKITEKVIVEISGTMSGSGMLSVKRTANVTFIGKNKAVAKGWGINISESKNVIIQNITFDSYSDDGVNIEKSEKVWVDHNTFTAGKDGACDVKKASTGVTISWNKFVNSEKTCLFGHSTKETGDSALRATYHHNYFSGTKSRMPRARYGKAHIYNNYYENIKLYGIASTCGAELLSENNYFKNCSSFTIIYPKKGTEAAEILSNNPEGKVKSVGDKFDNSTAPMLNDSGFSFKPSYSYSLTSVSSVPSTVKANAGAK